MTWKGCADLNYVYFQQLWFELKSWFYVSRHRITFFLSASMPLGSSWPFCFIESYPPKDTGPWQQPHQQDASAANLAGGAQAESQQAQLAHCRRFQRWACDWEGTKFRDLFTRKCLLELIPAGLQRLVSLELRGNGLYEASLSPQTFKPLRGLVDLYLGGNLFRFVPQGLPASLQVHRLHCTEQINHWKPG